MAIKTLNKKERRQQFLSTVACIVATMEAAEEWDVRINSHVDVAVPSLVDREWVACGLTGDITITIELKNVETERIVITGDGRWGVEG